MASKGPSCRGCTRPMTLLVHPESGVEYWWCEGCRPGDSKVTLRPRCVECGAEMERRVGTKGRFIDHWFWSCPAPAEHKSPTEKLALEIGRQRAAEQAAERDRRAAAREAARQEELFEHAMTTLERREARRAAKPKKARTRKGTSIKPSAVPGKPLSPRPGFGSPYQGTGPPAPRSKRRPSQ